MFWIIFLIRKWLSSLFHRLLFRRRKKHKKVFPPTNLKGVVLMPHTVVLTWTESLDTDAQYNVFRGSGGIGSEGKTPINPTPLPAGTTTFTDANAPVGVDAYFVTSVLGGVESVPSNEVAVQINLAPPTNLVIQSNT